MTLKNTFLTFGLAASACFFASCSDDSSSSPIDSTDVNTSDAITDSSGTGSTGETITQPSNSSFSYLPVTENATEGAQKLYNFLATHFGSYTVSGVQTGNLDASASLFEQEDLVAVYEAAGKYPALIGFDFLFATGVNASNSWYKEYTDATITLAEELWKSGGIPAFSWHWKDPSDAIDAFYTKKGNSSEYTTFDYSEGFVEGTVTWDETSDVYQQLVSDIDEIAAYFLTLQEHGVAAIFRPLHESGGNWFWWSATTTLHKGEEYAALYRLVYDRMVNVNGVKNLVWVWNAERSIFKDLTFDPGESYYDVFSVDIYNSSYDYQSNSSAFNSMKELHSGKILALSENGPIPDASLMHEDNAIWSYYMPWYESWSGGFVSKTKNTVWKANLEDNCVFALEDMPGWDNYTISNSKVSACTVGYTLASLDTTIDRTVNNPTDFETNGYLKVTASASSQDTAKGNVIIKSGSIDLSAAKTVTMTVDNSNNDAGVWFTIAFLGNAATSWGWAQPDGCWINGGESTTCEIDLSTTAQDSEILTGENYTTFMGNISKVYIEFFGEGFSGTLFYDNVVADDGTVINNFDSAAKITIEEGQFLAAEIVGGEN